VLTGILTYTVLNALALKYSLIFLEGKGKFRGNYGKIHGSDLKIQGNYGKIQGRDLKIQGNYGKIQGRQG
jgi:hypothetical protein